jgi:hypothetical protein
MEVTKMRKILLGLCILSLILIVGCTQYKDLNAPTKDLPDVEDVTCNADTLGTKAVDDCNTCTCTEYNGNYGWACTEIGCNAVPFI